MPNSTYRETGSDQVGWYNGETNDGVASAALLLLL